MLLSRLDLLDDSDPTNPLIPRERRNVLPCRQRLGVRNQSLFHISRQIMDHTTGNFFGHRLILRFGPEADCDITPLGVEGRF